VIDVHFEEGEDADRLVYDAPSAGPVAGVALHFESWRFVRSGEFRRTDFARHWLVSRR
jgi:hypothetical protein